MTVASNCEQPSSSTLSFLVALPLSSPVCSQYQRAEKHITSLFLSQSNSSRYQATPTLCSQKHSAPPHPLCTHPQLITDGSTSEGHLCPWAGKKCLHHDEKCPGKASVSNASHFCCCLWDRWSHRKMAGAKLKSTASLFIFSTYMTTRVHIHQLN